MSDKLAKVESGSALSVGVVPTTFSDVARMASALSKARGFVPDVYVGNAPALAAAIMAGLELGVGPMQAIRSIHIVKGKPVLDAAFMLSLAIRAGVRAQWIEQNAERAHLRLTRPGHEPHEHIYTMEDAKRAGLAGNDNYRKHPAAMLRARCISAAMRAWCPDVLGGSVYVEGEIVEGEVSGASAVVDEPERAPEEPATIEAQLVDAEAACSAPTEQPSERKRAKRTQLGDCGNADDLAAWIEANGAAVMRHGEAAIAKVVQRAQELLLEAENGAGEVTAREWVERRLAAVVKGEAA